MIFDNMEFHNVEELEKTPKGYIMWRVPGSLRPHLAEGAAQKAARFATGIELRFKMKSSRVVLKLCTEPMEEAQCAYIYYGAFQGGWTNSSRTVMEQETQLVIERPGNAEELRKITKEQELGFDPEVVRVVLPSGLLYYIGVEGDIEPPAPGETPARTYLAYGSSITHGSLGLASPFAYAFRISQLLHCDYLNMGFAGTAQAEEEMARYLCGRKDWEFASLELGVNMLKEEFSVELFESRVEKFVDIMARDGRTVFVTDVFGYNGDWQDKAAQYRRIVEKYASGRLIYTNGLELLNNPAFISQDMTHPTAEGQFAIAERWKRIMEEHLQR